jgi:hypothetical protein
MKKVATKNCKISKAKEGIGKTGNDGDTVWRVCHSIAPKEKSEKGNAKPALQVAVSKSS